jgi:hypothetical protein
MSHRSGILESDSTRREGVGGRDASMQGAGLPEGCTVIHKLAQKGALEHGFDPSGSTLPLKPFNPES